MYQQTNPLDFTGRTPVFPSAVGNEVGRQLQLARQRRRTAPPSPAPWRRLCTITRTVAGSTYLINVQTPGTTGDGVNGYALEAVAGGSHALPQPALYAYADMGMYNNNSCAAAGCTPAAGHLLPRRGRPAVRRARRSSSSCGTRATCGRRRATMFPKMPSPTAPEARSSTCRPPTCTYTSSPTPNAVQTGGRSARARTYATPQAVGLRARAAASPRPPAAPGASTAVADDPDRHPDRLHVQREHAVEPVNPETRQLVLVGHPVRLLATRHRTSPPGRPASRATRSTSRSSRFSSSGGRSVASPGVAVRR